MAAIPAPPPKRARPRRGAGQHICLHVFDQGAAGLFLGLTE
jgi:hypothetical protein